MNQASPVAGAAGPRCSHKQCSHGECPQCGGCEICEEFQTLNAIRERITDAGEDIAQALGHAESAHAAFLGLARGGLFNVGLPGWGAPDASGCEDAVARLTQITAGLRDVARIIKNRQVRDLLWDLEG